MAADTPTDPSSPASQRVERARLRLEEATAARAEHQRLGSRLAATAPALDSARREHERLEAEAVRQQDDVDRLERLSPSRIWASLRGDRDQRLTREEAEAQAAAYAAERARTELQRLEAEADRLTRDRDALARSDDAFEEALAEFADAVAADPGASLDVRTLAERSQSRLTTLRRRSATGRDGPRTKADEPTEHIATRERPRTVRFLAPAADEEGDPRLRETPDCARTHLKDTTLMQNSSLAGWGIALVVLGAILRWAVADALPGINLAVIGLILIVAGVATFALGFIPRGKATRVTHSVRSDDGMVEQRRDETR